MQPPKPLYRHSSYVTLNINFHVFSYYTKRNQAKYHGRTGEVYCSGPLGLDLHYLFLAGLFLRVARHFGFFARCLAVSRIPRCFFIAGINDPECQNEYMGNIMKCRRQSR